MASTKTAPRGARRRTCSTIEPLSMGSRTLSPPRSMLHFRDDPIPATKSFLPVRRAMLSEPRPMRSANAFPTAPKPAINTGTSLCFSASKNALWIALRAFSSTASRTWKTHFPSAGVTLTGRMPASRRAARASAMSSSLMLPTRAMSRSSLLPQEATPTLLPALSRPITVYAPSGAKVLRISISIPASIAGATVGA